MILLFKKYKGLQQKGGGGGGGSMGEYGLVVQRHAL